MDDKSFIEDRILMLGSSFDEGRPLESLVERVLSGDSARLVRHEGTFSFKSINLDALLVRTIADGLIERRRLSVRGIEDNSSTTVMANKEALHVKGTRHISDLKIFVQNKTLFTEMVNRSSKKLSATEFVKERQVSPKPVPPPPTLPVQKSKLLEKARAWGRDVGEKVLKGMSEFTKSLMQQRNQVIKHQQPVRMQQQQRQTIKPIVKQQILKPRPSLQSLAQQAAQNMKTQKSKTKGIRL